MILDLAAECASRRCDATPQVPSAPGMPLAAAGGTARPEPVQRHPQCHPQRSGAIVEPRLRSIRFDQAD